MFVGTVMTFISGATCALVCALGYRDITLTIMGSSTKTNYYEVTTL